jgi:AraC-like DNA-binding protein
MGAWANFYSWSYRDYLLSSFSWVHIFKLRKIHKAQELKEFKGRINFHLNLNYGNSEYNVTQLSKDMAMSRSQLFRKCKYILGKSPIHLLKSYRLEQSSELLRKGIYNVTEVAYLSGFSSCSYFCKSFKQKYKYIPSRLI